MLTFYCITGLLLFQACYWVALSEMNCYNHAYIHTMAHWALYSGFGFFTRILWIIYLVCFSGNWLSNVLEKIFKTNEWLKRHIHSRRVDQRIQLTVMLKGFYQYFGLTHCKAKLDNIHYEVKRQWRRAIKRQSERSQVFWSYLASKSWFKLPYAKTGLYPSV